jgi:uncharacterized repeat protein (TIGR01451 family)
MKRILFFALLAVFMISNVTGGRILAQGSEEDKQPFSITLDPVADINPVKTQHTIVATVLDKKNRPLSGQRVEWILARHQTAVGDIVQHDDMGATVGNTQITKLSNHYTVTYTNKETSVLLSMGTTTTSDDIKLTEGQTWITITSPVEGETHIIAFCPAIRDSTKHKAFAIKYWIDAQTTWPEDAVNRVGIPHPMTFVLRKASTNAPMPGYRVRWTLEDSPQSPAGYLGESKDQKVIEYETNEEGKCSTTLRQIKNAEGENKIKMELRKSTGELLAVRTVMKTWISPKITIKKEGPESGIWREKVVYTITLANPGAADANDVTVKDTIPEGFSYEECTLSPTKVQEKELIWEIGTLAKDATKKFLLTLRAEKTGTWTNTVQVTSKEAPTQTSLAVTKIVAPDLYLVKDGPRELRLGMSGTYTITLTNGGEGVARDVFIRDYLPEGMKYQNITKGTTLRWNVGELPSKQSRVFRYTLDTIRIGTFTNDAVAYMKTRQGPVFKVAHTTTVVAPDVKLTKKGPSLINLNKAAEYTITIANNGNGAAKSMVLVDSLPPSLEYISSKPRGKFKPAQEGQLATITWDLGDIPAKKEINIILEVRSNATGRCTNSVKLRSDSQEPPAFIPIEASHDTTIKGEAAIGITTYDTDDPVEVGKQTVYVIDLRNEGTSPCTNVKLEDEIDDEMEFISAKAPVSHKAEGNKVVFEPVPILQPGEKVRYEITVKAVKEGSAKNRAIVQYDQFTKKIISEEGTSVFK